MSEPLPPLSLSDWAVLALVTEGPTHGWPIVRELRSDGALGRVWTVARAVVYRSLATLLAAGYIEETGEIAAGRGPQRTVVRATRAGHGALGRWLRAPVDHVRDVRTELLLKLAVLDRRGRPIADLVERQRARLAPLVTSVATASHAEGFDAVLGRWRAEQVMAVDRFLQSLLDADHD